MFYACSPQRASFLGEAEGDWRVGRRRGQDGGRGARHVRDWAGWLCPQVPCRCFLRETPRCPEVSMSCRWRRRMSLSSSLPGPTWEAPTSTSRWSNISTRGRAMVDRWGGSLGCNNWPSWELMSKTGKKSRLLLFQFPSSSWPCKVQKSKQIAFLKKVKQSTSDRIQRNQLYWGVSTSSWL